MEHWTDLLPVIGAKVAMLHAIAGTLIPLMVVAVMTRFFGRNRTFREGLQIWKFALFASLSMTIPYVVIAHALGPEFPSLLDRWSDWRLSFRRRAVDSCCPEDEVWDFEPRESWDSEWNGIAKSNSKNPSRDLPLWKAWLPYLMIAVLLVTDAFAADRLASANG